MRYYIEILENYSNIYKRCLLLVQGSKLTSCPTFQRGDLSLQTIQQQKTLDGKVKWQSGRLLEMLNGLCSHVSFAGKGLCSHVSAFGEKTAAKPHSNELYDLRSTGKLVWNQQHNKDSGPTLSLNIELM